MFPLQPLLQQRRSQLFSLFEQAVGSEDLHRVHILFDVIADERSDLHIFNTKS